MNLGGWYVITNLATILGQNQQVIHSQPLNTNVLILYRGRTWLNGP